MTEKIFWLDYLILLLGILSIGYSLYSLKKREIYAFVQWIPELSLKRDSESPWDWLLFWYFFFLFFLGGIALVIVGLYVLFFV
jgi:hypothetical protein